VHSFAFLNFVASQAKQHTLKNHAFCNFMNAPQSWTAVTATTANASQLVDPNSGIAPLLFSTKVAER
jgi:hypothetical protein